MAKRTTRTAGQPQPQPQDNGGSNRRPKRNHNPATQTEEQRRRDAAWSAMLDNYSATYATRDKDPDAYADALQAVGIAVASSVLRQCIDVGYTDYLCRLRSDIYDAAAGLSRISYAAWHAYDGQYTREGEYRSKVIDAGAVRGAGQALRRTIGDGYDLAQSAMVAVMEETAAAEERNPGQPVDLRAPYNIHRLSAFVRIREEDSIGAWRDVNTTPIQEVHRAVRRAIMADRSVRTDPRNGYTYIDDITIDPRTGETVRVYDRLPLWADLGGYASRAISGDPESALLRAEAGRGGQQSSGTYTADRSAWEVWRAYMAAVRPTPLEARVIRVKVTYGCGNKAAATYLGVTANSVKCAMRRIAAKTRAAGITSDCIPAELYDDIQD